jgi:hypothetical protein
MRLGQTALVGLLLIGVSITASSAVAQTACTDAKIKGDFGFSGTGLVPRLPSGAPVTSDPINQIAAVNYDGNGVVSLRTRVQYHGSLSPTAPITGTYKVSNDCTGVAEFKDSTGTVAYTWAFVIVHGGDEIETMALIAAKPGRPMYSMSFSQKKL